MKPQPNIYSSWDVHSFWECIGYIQIHVQTTYMYMYIKCIYPSFVEFTTRGPCAFQCQSEGKWQCTWQWTLPNARRGNVSLLFTHFVEMNSRKFIACFTYLLLQQFDIQFTACIHAIFFRGHSWIFWDFFWDKWHFSGTNTAKFWDTFRDIFQVLNELENNFSFFILDF